MRVRSIISISILWLFLAATPLSTQAQERINSFDAEINLTAQGTAEVTETIVYDFGDNQRRGIFRNIPFVYNVEGGQGYVSNLTITSVSRDGLTEPYIIDSISNGFNNIRIGNADVTITGAHTYEINYQLTNVVVQAVDGNDIFRFDAPGTGWDVPVDSASITVNSEINPRVIICFQGILGATDTDCDISDNSVSSSDALVVGETITIESVYPSGSFSNYAVLEDISTYSSSGNDSWIGAIIGIAVAVISFGTIGYVAAGQLAYQRRRKNETVYARYEPPKDMSAAEIGLLLDNSSSGAEISAAIISMAVKGHLRIELLQKKSFFRKSKLAFTSTDKPTTKLPEGENTIYWALFDGKAGKTVKSTDFTKSQSFAKEIQKFHKGLKESLKKKGFYKPVNLFSWSLAQRMTDKGYAKWAEVEGFRDFLKVTEADRLAFHDAPKRSPEQFSEFLPYAQALGVEKEWAKQFEDLNVDISDWYEGGGNAVATGALASNISSMSSGLNGFSSSASSSGSSGSGGGFSGGGSGGGGGGSW